MSMQTVGVLPAPAIELPSPTGVHAALAARTGRDNLHVGVASTIEAVTEAWQLVYDSYRRIDIIDENPAGLHTNIHTLYPNTSVVVGRLNGEAVSTLTIMHDGEHGLPLDRIYNRQLNLLRRMGRPIAEVGLLADRREKAGRALAAIMEMMRFAFWNGRFHGADMLCGVHPHHAAFYIKTFGFDVIGPVMTHPAVRHQPVVLLRLDIEHQMRSNSLPRGLAQYVQNELSANTFDARCRLNPQVIKSTPIAQYLHYRGLLSECGRVTSPVPSWVWRQPDEQGLAA